MNTKEFKEQFHALVVRMEAQMEAKNNDYAGKRDPLKNLRKHGVFGILVRMGDKLDRLDSFFNPAEVVERRVADETADDTLIDLATYALLAVVLRNDDALSVARAKIAWQQQNVANKAYIEPFEGDRKIL